MSGARVGVVLSALAHLIFMLLSPRTGRAPAPRGGPWRGGPRASGPRGRPGAALERARSRLYRNEILQVNMRWKALAKIYTMHSFAPFSNLNFFVKNRQNFFAIELMNFH